MLGDPHVQNHTHIARRINRAQVGLAISECTEQCCWVEGYDLRRCVFETGIAIIQAVDEREMQGNSLFLVSE